MSNHDDSCEAQGPGESCCCVYRAEIERLRALLREAPGSGIWRDGEWISPAPEWYQRAREALGDE